MLCVCVCPCPKVQLLPSAVLCHPRGVQSAEGNGCAAAWHWSSGNMNNSSLSKPCSLCWEAALDLMLSMLCVCVLSKQIPILSGKKLPSQEIRIKHSKKQAAFYFTLFPLGSLKSYLLCHPLCSALICLIQKSHVSIFCH